MVHWLRLIILGAVQGITEFVPVSSSGHLVLFQELLGLEYEGITLEIAVHVGTLFAVGAVYWRDCLKIAASALRNGWRIARRQVRFSDAMRDPRFYLAVSIFLATLATVLAIFPLSDSVRHIFHELPLVVAAWLLTSILLWRTRDLRPTGLLPGLGVAVIIGLFQALAVIPGISRSGATIAAGLFFGLSRREAARFSFLLSVPAIAGAALLDVPGALGEMADPGFLQDAILATIVAAISGYFALRFVIGKVVQGELHKFVYYLVPLALAVSVWQVL